MWTLSNSRRNIVRKFSDSSLTGSRDDLDPDRYYVDSFELPYCEIDILEPDYYQNIQSEELYDQTSNCVANFEEIQLNSNGCVKYLPYIVVPELDNTKLLIDTGATDSIINPDLADLYFTDSRVPSSSPYAAPVSLVSKKLDHSGIPKFRMVIDYRKLNEKTIGDKYPLPLITDILDRLGRANYFSTLDLASGYHQIEVQEEDRHKTAFCTEIGQFEFKRLPFGLKNAGATFQRCMNFVLGDLLKDTCLVYLYDIIVYSTSLQEHLSKLRTVSERLREANLKISLDKTVSERLREANLKISLDKCDFLKTSIRYLGHLVTDKCDFLKTSIRYLGHLVTDKGVRPDPAKVDAIQRVKLPETQKQIKSFLGLVGYYEKQI
ncbi:Reverse transcriptase (RNA-dependent DNA polymerase) [Popillia japonica]|uniref:Reverse transcriptase (RNA-dependent DNA polymerase) n=1 Tax=Popillia japonica TaxID=7064 RepID=A0AAW1NBT5_POPJA